MTAARRLRHDSSFAANRVNQFMLTVTHRHRDEIDHRIRALLDNEAQWRLVARLPAFDRAHHLSVHELLAAQGFDDQDLLRAALLHDIGKSDGDHQVRLPDRVARVLGRRIAPVTWIRLAGRQSWPATGWYLAEHHARLGAAAARETGATERCCELILRHEETPPTGDELLDALIEADGAAIR